MKLRRDVKSLLEFIILTDILTNTALNLNNDCQDIVVLSSSSTISAI